MGISQTTMLMADGPAQRVLRAGTGQRPQVRTLDGEVVWNWIALAYAVYWTLFVVGVYAGMPQLNSAGAVVLLAVMGWTALERRWVRVDGVFIASLAAAFIPVLSHGGETAGSTDLLVKHVALCMVIAMSRILRLPPASSSRARWRLAAPVLAVLALCVFVSRGSSWDSPSRHSGLFVNPNTLALIPFLLLLLVNQSRDRGLVRVGAHGIAAAVLVFTGTSGAVVAYAVGLTTHVISALPRVWRISACVLMVIAGSIGIALTTGGGQAVLPDTRLSKQLLIVNAEAQVVFNGGTVNFYGLEQKSGQGSTSGLWRLFQWQRILSVYADGTRAEQLFGFGIGSSMTLVGNLPHNEYLRQLLEQGAVGLALFVFVWARIIMSAPREVRYIGLIFAIYSITENNLDNFPFMSMLALCLSASGREPLWRRGPFPRGRRGESPVPVLRRPSEKQ